MHRDVVRFIAFDLVLRLVVTGVMGVSLVVDILCVDLDNPATDMSGLGIPGDVIADFEAFSHLFLPNAQRREAIQFAYVRFVESGR